MSGPIYQPHGEIVHVPMKRQPKYSILPLPWAGFIWAGAGSHRGKYPFYPRKDWSQDEAKDRPVEPVAG